MFYFLQSILYCFVLWLCLNKEFQNHKPVKDLFYIIVYVYVQEKYNYFVYWFY